MVSDIENFYETLSESILSINDPNKLQALLNDRKNIQKIVSYNIRYGRGLFVDGRYVESELNSKVIDQIENILFLLI